MNLLKKTRTSVGTTIACLLALIAGAAGCGTSPSNGLPPVDPTNNPPSPQPGPNDELGELLGLSFEDGDILLDGVRIMGNPESLAGGYYGEEATEGAAEPEDVRARGKGDTAKSIVEAISMGVTANPVNVNTNVTFTATVTGGTGLYYFFWWLEGDTQWTQAGRSYTRTLTRTPRQSMWFVAIDTNRVQSDLKSWFVNVSAAATTPTGAISASQTANIRAGTNVTFTAVNVQGGTAPYTYFWMLDHDTAWTPGTSSITRQIDGSAPARRMNLVIRDATNRDSAMISLDMTVDLSSPAPSTVCPTMAGTWSATYGTMHLTQSGNVQTGATVSGTYDYSCPGTITGTVRPSGSTACPNCLTWSGTWSESGPSCSPKNGTFQFDVDPDLGHFVGSWSYSTGGGGGWSGDHDKCGDGSDPRPRQ